jgi:hypothetical protein
VRGPGAPHTAVASRRAHDELAVLVDQLDARPIELGLAEVRDRLVARQHPPHPLVEGLELLGSHGVVEGEHRLLVADGDEPLGGRGAHPLGGRVRAPELGVLPLEIDQLAQQLIELGVADLRRILDVIEAQMALHLA